MENIKICPSYQKFLKNKNRNYNNIYKLGPVQEESIRIKISKKKKKLSKLVDDFKGKIEDNLVEINKELDLMRKTRLIHLIK